MNKKNDDNKQFEDLLRKAHLPEPSSELKERVTSEAKNTWLQTSPELPWQIPVRRLLVSSAAAVFIIWLANCSSDYALARWQSGGFKSTYQRNSNLDALMEIPYSPLAKRLVLAGRRPSLIDASTLRSYAETMFQILDEAKQNGFSKPAAPFEGRSHLFPIPSGFDSYS